MANITYKDPTDAQKKKDIAAVVYLEGKKIGCIFARLNDSHAKKAMGTTYNFQYIPEGKNTLDGGAKFGTMQLVKKDIEGED